MAPKVEGASGRVRAAAFLVTAALVAGPVGTHVYWMLGGTWGLHSSTTMGIRAVAAVVVMLLLAAVMVVLARVGLWQQAFASDRVIRLLAWALAGFFLTHALVSFAEGRAGSLDEWWLYGPSGLVIGLLALVVAGSGGAWPIHRLHRTLPSHRRHRDEGPGVTARVGEHPLASAAQLRRWLRESGRLARSSGCWPIRIPKTEPRSSGRGRSS
jgi:hypothetical protein